jgi:hypothetical protein
MSTQADSSSLLRRLIRAFLLRAAVILVVFALLHLLGFRRYTCLISGTASFGYFQGVCGAAYIVFYGLAVVGIPVLLLASGLAKVIEWSVATVKGRSSDGGAQRDRSPC